MGEYLHQGYWVVHYPQHHFAHKSGSVLKHRLVYEQHNKCILMPWCHLHHINGNTEDNRIDNLQPYSKGEHSRIEHLGEQNVWYGKHLSEKHRRNLSISGKGKKRSEEARRRLSLSKMGPKNPNYGKVPWNKKL